MPASSTRGEPSEASLKKNTRRLMDIAAPFELARHRALSTTSKPAAADVALMTHDSGPLLVTER